MRGVTIIFPGNLLIQQSLDPCESIAVLGSSLPVTGGLVEFRQIRSQSSHRRGQLEGSLGRTNRARKIGKSRPDRCAIRLDLGVPRIEREQGSKMPFARVIVTHSK